MKKRVTHIIDGLAFGGAERILQALVMGMCDQYEIEVITLSKDPLEGQEIALELMQAGIDVVHIPKRSKLGGAAFARLVNHLQSTNPDVVHTHLFAADVWGARAAFRAHVPVLITTEHNINHDEGIMKQWAKCRMHPRRDAIIAISAAVEQYIAEICPEVEHQIQLIPNGVDYARFAPVRTRREWKSDKVARMAVVGRLEVQKGQEQLLHTLAATELEYSLQIVGEGSQRGELLRTMDEHDMHEQVTIQPARDDIEEIYREADIVIMPSLWEGFGLVALEAMAAGCIVIASPVDGLEETIQHGVNGFLVDMTDPEELEKVIKQVQSDPELRAQIQDAAEETVRTQYTYDAMVEQYIGLYESFLISDHTNSTPVE